MKPVSLIVMPMVFQTQKIHSPQTHSKRLIDSDGVGDNADAFPNDASETIDTDGDGIGNNADTDDDGGRLYGRRV